MFHHHIIKKTLNSTDSPLSQSSHHWKKIGQAWFALVNPYWLFPITFSSSTWLGDGFQEDLLQKLPRAWSYTDWPAIPWILLLNLLEDGCDVCQSWGTCPDSHELLKLIEGVLAVTSAGSLSSLVCIWSDSINLQISNFFKWSVTSSSTSVGNASLPQTLALCSGIWKESLSVKKEEKKLLSSSFFSATFWKGLLPSWVLCNYRIIAESRVC